MSKCHVRYFLRLYAAIFKDILTYRPDLRLDMERDYSRIVSSSESMGIRVFTEFLPEIRKVLDLSLSQGCLDRSSIPFMRVCRNGSHIPRLFKGMWLHLFTHDGVLKQDIDPDLILAFRTLLDVGRKYEMECPPSALYETTEDFYVTDQSLPEPSLDWLSPSSIKFDPSGIELSDLNPAESDQYDLFGRDCGASTRLLDTVQRCADIVSTDFGEFTADRFRHGPGAVAERLKGVEKFKQDRWSPRLEEQFPYLGNAAPLGSDHNWIEAEIASRLIAVPKTIKGPRLIAAEPTDHLWCQFSIMDYCYDRVGDTLLGSSIDFRNQVPSQQAALLGSKTGATATVDLKSASDRISLWLVERFFRRNLSLLLAMRACRTAFVDLSIDKKLPSLIRLRKFTTQGSALTFPIQSIVFATLAIGVGLHVTGKPVTYKSMRKIAKEVRVFGDDIIIPKDWVDDYRALLESLYLRVNTQKTHYHGLFRESCGMDAYAGYDVTPPHVIRFGSRAAPSAATSVVECSNNFVKKGFMHAAQMMVSTLPRSIRDFIPVRRVADGSIHFFSFSGDQDPPRAKSRWNHDYQRKEVLVLTQKVRKKRLEVDGSLSLKAYLASSEFRPLLPSYEGIQHWRPLSRWEALPVVGKGWVPSFTCDEATG